MKTIATPTHRGLPPGPQGTLIGGSIRQFAPRRLDFLLNLARQYGPLASFRLGHRRIFLASDPELIERVLVNDAKHYIKHFGTRAYKPLLGNGLVTSEGDFWRRQRRLTQPSFTRTEVLSYMPAMSALTEEMLASWRPGKAIDVQLEFSALARAIALKTLFNLDRPVDRERFSTTLMLAIDLMTARLRWPIQLPMWLPTPTNRQLLAALADLHHVVDEFIAAGRSRPHLGDDFLSRLLWAQDEDGTRMSDRQLRDGVMTLYLSAHETTALAVSWTWYLLSQHPQVDEKLVAEWRHVLNGRYPSTDDLARMPYTSAVIAESLRLYPPVFGIGREATRDLILGGYRVKRGYTVLLSQWVSHRDPKYFSDPERFCPERWDSEFEKRLPRFAYFPFGGGQRKCIGRDFALTEAATILSAVGQRYKFTLDVDANIDVNPQITLHPKFGIPATLERRDGPKSHQTS